MRMEEKGNGKPRILCRKVDEGKTLSNIGKMERYEEFNKRKGNNK